MTTNTSITADRLANRVSDEPRLVDQLLERLDQLESWVQDELALYRSAGVRAGCDLPPGCVVSVVIPVYNEAATVVRVISRVAALPLPLEIVVVDDASTDGTAAALERLAGVAGLVIIRKPHNEGKGAALRTGFEHARGDIVVVQDADLEYDPRDIPGLIEPILRDEADIVYGSRFLADPRQDRSWIHRFGNWLLTQTSNLLSGLRLTDMETGYKAITREALKDIVMQQPRFGIEPELTAKLARRGYRFAEVPIAYRARSYQQGKKIGVKDLFQAIWCIGRYGVHD
jgi:glycosyltransferase involved in cell wall biosynthesis